MTHGRYRIAGIAAALSIFGAAAHSQAVFDAIDAGETDWIDATLVEVDESERTITVRFEEGGDEHTFYVTEDAEILRTGGNIHTPIELDDMILGTELRLEFDGLEGEETLRRVLEASS